MKIKDMKNSKTAIALDFFCGMLRFRTREAGFLVSRLRVRRTAINGSKSNRQRESYIIPQAVEIMWE